MSFETDPSQNQNRNLHICTKCSSNLVQPERWQQASQRGSWRVWLRCPECEHREDDVFDERTIDRFDEKLDLGTEQLADNLYIMEKENMENMVGAFTTALESDLIGPDDFSTRRPA